MNIFSKMTWMVSCASYLVKGHRFDSLRPPHCYTPQQGVFAVAKLPEKLSVAYIMA